MDGLMLVIFHAALCILGSDLRPWSCISGICSPTTVVSSVDQYPRMMSGV